MTTIGFIRHGVTAWNKEGRAQGSSDIPLDEEGIAMAERVAQRLEQEQWDFIYTSPLLRAAKTAEIIADRQQGLDLLSDARLREVGGGLIEGTTEQERVEKWGFSWRTLDMGFEPDELVRARGMEFVEDMKRLHPGKRILVVSHGGFIKQLINELVREKDLTNGFENTSVTIVELREDRNRCDVFNCTNHLQTS